MFSNKTTSFLPCIMKVDLGLFRWDLISNRWKQNQTILGYSFNALRNDQGVPNAHNAPGILHCKKKRCSLRKILSWVPKQNKIIFTMNRLLWMNRVTIVWLGGTRETNCQHPIIWRLTCLFPLQMDCSVKCLVYMYPLSISVPKSVLFHMSGRYSGISMFINTSRPEYDYILISWPPRAPDHLSRNLCNCTTASSFVESFSIRTKLVCSH